MWVGLQQSRWPGSGPATRHSRTVDGRPGERDIEIILFELHDPSAPKPESGTTPLPQHASLYYNINSFNVKYRHFNSKLTRWKTFRSFMGSFESPSRIKRLHVKSDDTEACGKLLSDRQQRLGRLACCRAVLAPGRRLKVSRCRKLTRTAAMSCFDRPIHPPTHHPMFPPSWRHEHVATHLSAQCPPHAHTSSRQFKLRK